MMSVVIASGVGHCTEVKLKLCGVCWGESSLGVLCVACVCMCACDRQIDWSVHTHACTSSVCRQS